MKPTLIIVDDIKGVRERLHVALQGEFEILEKAADGYEAVEAVKRQSPELVLMDVVMPGRTGIEATEIITQTLPDPPKIVMLSGIRDENVVLQAFEAGAADYLFKPIDEPKLIRVLWEVMRSAA